jgi:hypothetical protein
MLSELHTIIKFQIILMDTIFRKSEQDDKGFIVVIFVVDINYGTKDIIQNHRIVDFTNILPNFPHEGVIVAASDHTDKDHQHIG